ncbi:hypothetical protein GLOTRDRAFT_133761 [Gloeophyllum trabeum ATCC 11539]|uniref:Uncharacterized protein n=1 Tax=Gloeophyllum trabeum (strain ATCC 11539 / FP-39264 / Madison 617) TaxID=670483 RepID=S7PS69_GLOTA|nr:uncharacterized protein GLOTRDRAFT_133761 [Gloeophyllum trabeum ATCC 11539]EPQ50651.1 hypothetical protein GLOTRDRAFT_133761 [Gloeophyllum trabeum ATCC 11539]
MHYIHSQRLASPSSHCVLLPHNSARAARSSYTGPICSSTRGAIDKQNILLDNFGKSLERLGMVGAEKREWVMMAVVNIGSNLERGFPSGVLKTGVFGASAASTSSATAKVKLAKKQDDGDSKRMDVDEDEDADGNKNMKLEKPTRKKSVLPKPTLNPYITITLTFLATLLRHETMRLRLERALPREDLATFYSRPVLTSIMTHEENLRWAMLTSSCHPLPEGWSIRGMAEGFRAPILEGSRERREAC